jgi:hypothetical protein
MGEWSYSHNILNLCIRWSWVVSFMNLSLYPLENSPQYPLYRRLDGPQTWSGRYREEKSILPLTRIEHRLLGRLARSLVAPQTKYASGHFSIINSSCTTLFKPCPRLPNVIIERVRRKKSDLMHLFLFVWVCRQSCKSKWSRFQA